MFLDVLGAKNIIRSGDLAGLWEALSSGFDLLRQCDSPSGNPISQWEMKTFSDNVLLAFSIETDDSEIELAVIFDCVSPFLFHMACRGFFVRGGLVVGSLCIDVNRVLGEALLSAYELEQKACYPRVVVDLKIVDLLRAHIKRPHFPNSAWKSFFLQDCEKQVFVNYLQSQILRDDEDGAEVVVERIEQHREQIEKQLRENEAHGPVRSKYCWLAAYHNHFVSDLKKSGYRNGANFISERLFVPNPKHLFHGLE